MGEWLSLHSHTAAFRVQVILLQTPGPAPTEKVPVIAATLSLESSTLVVYGP